MPGSSTLTQHADEVRKMLAERVSYPEIARVFKVSKAAVSGWVYRYARSEPAPKRVRKPKAKRQHSLSGAALANRMAGKYVPDFVERPSVLQPPASGGKTLFEIGANDCRRPLWVGQYDPANSRFCAEPVEEGTRLRFCKTCRGVLLSVRGGG